MGLEKASSALDAQLSIAHSRITESFPGGPAPALVVVAAADITAPEVGEALGEFEDVTVHRDENVAEFELPLPRGAADLTDLRDKRLPAAFDGTGAKAHVTGETAGSVDFNDQLRRGIVPVFVFITAVTFLLMLFCFRSYVIAVTSIVLNLLSVATSYGVMTAVFQHGLGASLIGSEGIGAIEAWMPLFVLVVLFGLSRLPRSSPRTARAAPGQPVRIETGLRRTAGVAATGASGRRGGSRCSACLAKQDMPRWAWAWQSRCCSTPLVRTVSFLFLQ
ncbi:MMPL family transporter [Streptomyces californicus]